MDASGFIARRLRFKGKTAMVSIAVSYLVMILAVAVSSGFRREIRNGVSTVCGDVQLTSADMNYINEDSPVSSNPPSLESILKMPEVNGVAPVVYRAGIVKNEDNIHGVLFKGLPDRDDLDDLGISIPTKLADLLGLSEGDDLLAYFVGERVKMRKFHIRSTYRSMVDADDRLIIHASMEDLQRLNGWEADEVSALEISLGDKFRKGRRLEDTSEEIGTRALLYAGTYDDVLVATSAVAKYPQLFDWLDLIDFNALFILILMTIVAGFNMISGLLILLFQNISTIGILKSMGMTDKSIAATFIKVSSNLVLKGMAVGNAVALLFCAVQGATHFIRLNPDNYFISFVPVHVNLPVILVADALSYLVIMLLLLLPSLFISKVDPAQTVRAQ